MKKKNKSKYLLLFMPIVYLLIAIAIVVVVSRSGIYPSGSDTMYHIYRGDSVYRSIKEGNWYPLYNAMWYNGVELMRYWAPLPAYFVAACQALAGGNQLNGYLIFVVLIFFLGALPWLYIGQKTGRPYLGAFLGILWFFMPNNLTALFVEGNLARSVCMIFLPLFIYSVFYYMKERKWHYLPLMITTFTLMVLCHLGYAGMIALSVLLYLLVCFIMRVNRKAGLEVIGAMLLGFALVGIWMVGSLRGGITSLDNSENMAKFFQSVSISLNPLERFDSNNGNFYFGLAAFLLAAYGVIFSYKKSQTGFWTGILILLGSTTVMYPVLKILPGSQYLWMLRFISIALCMILCSFLMWDTLKKPIVVVFLLLLCLDVYPSLSVVYGEHNGASAVERLEAQQEYTLIRKAQEIANQRVALLDESSLGATGAWLLSGWGNRVAASFGAGREAANTSVNIVQINRALTDGQYYYVFDRCKELGNDTVLVRLSQLNPYTDSIFQLHNAAVANGYELVESNGGYRLYHIDTDKNWGTKTIYRAIAIGSGADTVARQFPAMEEVDTDSIDDFTYEELSKYDLIFLNGFTYNDKKQAEDLVVRLSEHGVRIVICMDGIPQDKKTHDQNFLDVRCNAITFQNGYPEMETRIGTLYTDLFPQGHTNWQTIYLEGLDTSWGTIYENGFKLDFYGTVRNENIVMVGLNLTYFFGLTHDRSVAELLSNMMDLSANELPKRTIVPLSVTYGTDSIAVTSKEDAVNTSIAYHDIFSSVQHLEEKNHLTYVDEGTTVITMHYPYFWQGLLVSLAGVIILIGWLRAMWLRLKEEHTEIELLEAESVQQETVKETEENDQKDKSDI